MLKRLKSEDYPGNRYFVSEVEIFKGKITSISNSDRLIWASSWGDLGGSVGEMKSLLKTIYAVVGPAFYKEIVKEAYKEKLTSSSVLRKECLEGEVIAVEQDIELLEDQIRDLNLVLKQLKEKLEEE